MFCTVARLSFHFKTTATLDFICFVIHFIFFFCFFSLSFCLGYFSSCGSFCCLFQLFIISVLKTKKMVNLIFVNAFLLYAHGLGDEKLI